MLELKLKNHISLCSRDVEYFCCLSNFIELSHEDVTITEFTNAILVCCCGCLISIVMSYCSWTLSESSGNLFASFCWTHILEIMTSGLIWKLQLIMIKIKLIPRSPFKLWINSFYRV